MSKKIHVIGGKGYVGGLLVKYLKAEGHVVELAEYRLPAVKPNSIDCDILLHLASAGGGTVHKPRFGNDDPVYMESVNLLGMRNALSGLVNKEAKVLFLSSTAVYGKFDDERMVDECSELLPVSNYGLHKKQAEQILKDSGFDYMILRPCGIFGASINNNFGNAFLNSVLDATFKNREIKVFGGNQKIDTAYLLDVVKTILFVCDGGWQSNAIFNLGGEITTVQDMLESLQKAFFSVGLNYNLTKVAFDGKPSAITNSEKAGRILNYQPTALSESLKTLVTDYVRR